MHGGEENVSLLNTEVDLLRRVPLFAGIEPARLKLLAYTSDVVTYQASQVLFKRGDVGDAAYVIIKGDAEVIVASDDAARSRSQCSTTETSSARSRFSAIRREPRRCSAKGELKALRIRKEPFFELLHQFPEMAVEMTRLLAERLTRTTAELVEAQRRAHA